MMKIRNPLIDSAAALAAITAYLYCAGTAYYGGYLNTLFLDQNILDRNLHQTLYKGFLHSILPVFKILGAYVAYRIAYSHIFYRALNDLQCFIKLKRATKRILYGRRTDSEIEVSEKRHSIVFLMYLLALLSLVAMLAHVEKKGKKYALSKFEIIENNSIQAPDLITVKVGGVVKELLHLACGSRNCAGIDPKTKNVYYFQQRGFSYSMPSRKTLRSVDQAKAREGNE